MNMQCASVCHAEHMVLKSQDQTQWFKGSISTARYTKVYTCSSSYAGFLTTMNMQFASVGHAKHMVLKSQDQTQVFKSNIGTAIYTKAHQGIYL